MRPTQPTLNRFGLSSGPGCAVGLDHADQPVAVAQRVVDHGEIARLENVERHLPARQQQRARQRKHRNRSPADRQARDRPRSSAWSVSFRLILSACPAVERWGAPWLRDARFRSVTIEAD
jgi:hypothetical protein